MSATEIQSRASFAEIRYAQCWEDSRLLRLALRPAGRHCLSIGSAGDNSFALLAAGAASVTAVEMNPAQIACIDLRRAAYLTLDHPGFLELIGSRPSEGRAELYAKCRAALTPETAAFWDARPTLIDVGIGSAGKFERYFATFRKRVLPLAHSRKRVADLLRPRDRPEREDFYERVWNNRRWRAIFRVFFSRFLMGKLGRDPAFFNYVEGSVADRILERARHALVELEPAKNPYLHWILTGTHGVDLPEALEAENFPGIRQALAKGKFRMIESPVEALLDAEPERKYGAFNLSDIFEYMSETNTAALLDRLRAAAEPGGRLAYWNMLAPRGGTPSDLLAQDRAFFYSRFLVEETGA